MQTRFFAWQFVSYVCEAIEVATDRGVDQPRRVSADFNNIPVGRFGSELAESLVVNLLYPNLDEQRLAAGTLEADALRDLLDDRGSAAADTDAGLVRLRSLLAGLSSDIAPVGGMCYGWLQPCVILTHKWLVVASEGRLRGCEVTGHLIEMLRTLGRPYGELAIDLKEDNLRWYADSAPRDVEDVTTYPIAEGLLRLHRGGLYRGALVPYLLSAPPPRPRVPS